MGLATNFASGSAIALQMFKRHSEKVIQVWEFGNGMAFMLSPLAGTYLMMNFGDYTPFIIIGSSTTFFSIMAWVTIPNLQPHPQLLTKTPPPPPRNSISSYLSVSISVIKYFLKVNSSILFHQKWHILAPLLAILLTHVGYGMVLSMLEPHLKDTIGATENEIALIYSGQGMCILTSSTLYPFVRLLLPSKKVLCLLLEKIVLDCQEIQVSCGCKHRQ